MPVDAATRHVFAYGATALQLADEHTMAFVSGNTLQFTSTVTNSQHFLTRNKARKLLAFDFNWRNSEFAITSRDPNPEILIYSYPDKKLRGKLQNGGASMEYAHLKYSRCGRRLITLRADEEVRSASAIATAEPSGAKPVVSRLCVWDLEKYEPLKGCGNGNVTIDVAFMSFDPSNSDHFLLGGVDGLQLWKIYKGKTSHSLRQVMIKLNKWTTTSTLQAIKSGITRGLSSSGHHHRSPLYEGEVGDGDVEQPQDTDERKQQLVCHAWMRGNRVLLANSAGELLIVDTAATTQGSEVVGVVVDIATRPNRCCIVGIIYTAETIVVVYADGYVVWLQESDYTVMQTATLPCAPSHVRSDSAIDAVVASVAPSPTYSKVYIGTCDGHIYELKVAVVSDDDESEGAEEVVGSHRELIPRAGGDALTSRGSPQSSLLVSSCGSFHVGLVLASAPLTPCGSFGTSDIVIASGGSNGRLYLWSVTKCRLVAETNLLVLFASCGSEISETGIDNIGNGSTPAGVASASASVRNLNNDRSIDTSSNRPVEEDDEAGVLSNATSSSCASTDQPVIGITSLAARVADPILVIGDQHGKLRVLCVSKVVGHNGGLEFLPLQSVQLLNRHCPLDLLELHPTQPCALVASTLDRHLFLVSIDYEQQFRVLAYVSIPFNTESEHIVDIKWSTPPSLPSALVFTFSTTSGKCYCVRHVEPTTTSGTVPLPIQLKPTVVAMGGKEDPLPLLTCAKLQFLTDAPINVFLLVSPRSHDINVLRYADANASEILNTTRDRTSNPPLTLTVQTKVLAQDAHESGIAALAIYGEKLKNGEELFATAGTNGVVTLWLLSLPHGSTWQLEDIQVVKKKTLVPHLGVITSLSFLRVDADEVFLVTTGVDGSVCLVEVRISTDLRGVGRPPSTISPLYVNIANFAKYENPFVPDPLQDRVNGSVGDTTVRPYLDLLQDELEIAARNRFDPFKDKTRAHLNDLKMKLKMLLTENDDLPESERLTRDEFVVNTEWRDRVLQKNGKRADAVREGILRDLAKINIVRERMKAEFWDSASVSGIRLRGLATTNGTTSTTSITQAQSSNQTTSSLFVYNFPMRRLSNKETLRMRRIELLRLIECEHQKQELAAMSTISNSGTDTAVSRFQDVVSPGLQWLINAGMHHPSLNRWITDKSKVMMTTTTTTTTTGKEDKKDNAVPPQPSSATLTVPTGSALLMPVTLPSLNDVKAFHLVYHPAAIRTRKQQRTQIQLVKSYVRYLLVEFNRDFQELVKLKQTKMEEVETKNTRIQEIARELGNSLAASDLFRPQWAPDEIATSILEVNTDEMTQKPYESTEARHKREREAAELRELERQRQKDDVAGRALRDMMDGTLEVKKENLVQQTLVKETWMMEIPIDDMTVEQKKLVTQFEAAQQKLREEQEKYKKSLDLELKKIKSEIQDIGRAFDDKVRALRDIYLSMRMSVLVQQLYELRLAEDILEHEHFVGETQRIQAKIMTLTQELRVCERENELFGVQVEVCREECHRAAEDDRALEKGFLRELEEQAVGLGITIDHDMTKHLVELYKKRNAEDLRTGPSALSGTVAGTGGGAGTGIGEKKARKSNLPIAGSKRRLLTEATGQSSRQVTGATAQVLQSLQAVSMSISSTSADGSGVDHESNFDPFADVEMPPPIAGAKSATTAASTQRQVVPLDYEVDRPDGIAFDERLWRALNELRTRKILAEHNVRERADQFNHARAVAEELRVQLQELQLSMQLQTLLLESTKKQLKAMADNTPLLVHIKQGQDETTALDNLMRRGKDNNVVTGSTGRAPSVNEHDALLVARSSVESLNEVIQLHGKDQVGILNKIKNFRKNINVMEWEHKLLDMETRDMEERYTDIQLLRVTKELQELFHTGDTTEKQKREVAQLEAKLEHVGKNHQTNSLKLDKTHTKLEKQLRERMRENAKFQDQVQQLARQVQIREDILVSHKSAALRNANLPSGHDMGENARMKAITVRRKLVDLARAQTEEIDYLRMELDKMRRRTFPSFAQQQIARDYHPSDAR